MDKKEFNNPPTNEQIILVNNFSSNSAEKDKSQTN